MLGRGRFGALVVCALLVCSIAQRSLANEACESRVGDLVSAEGVVDVQRDKSASWQRAALNARLCRGDTIRVGSRSRAALALINDAVLRLDQNTTLRLINIGEQAEEESFLDLIVGVFQSFSRKPRKLSVNTPYINATIEGTEFLVRVATDRSEVTVFEGHVAAANDAGRLVLAPGQSAVARAGQAPQARTLVRPRDAVQWALHYPPILAALGGGTGKIPTDSPAPLAEALRLAGGGDVAGAFAALDRVPAGGRDARFQVFRAALELSVGRVEAARAGIGDALAQNPNDGNAFALSAVIAVVQNETARALAEASRAVELSPDEAAPKIALSYAQQAAFRLEDARDTLSRAVEQQPGDPLAQARLAELWLSLGYRRQALEAAERAVALAPDLERTQVVLGFAALVRFDTDTAKAAFGRAIDLVSSDPLPRLGLGLARIHEGDLEAGRRELEIAVGLDSGNALLRAYLGKAYFEEKRAPLDAEQLAIAKGLDPFDPTAYFYDAIRKQSDNRPGEALTDLQASIARNDNRAVYRGRQQLDQDRAARGTSLARIYDDLGFQQLGVNEASRSLSLDPGNASAHRFLSDNYGSIRRREIARVSELLQAQLLQDVNINPVQPSLSETNLNIITRGGPAEAGFNEFTPLFERNQLQADGSAVIGNNDTWGGEAVASALYNGISISAGGFHYQTDGFRTNHGIDHDIYNVFAQAALTPEFNIQAEFRRRDSASGDLKLNFDPETFNPELERDLEQDIARLGARFSPTPGSNVLFSYIHSNRDELNTEGTLLDFGIFAIDAETDDKIKDDGDQVEAQYQQQFDWLNFTAGAGYTDTTRDRDFSLLVASDFTGFPPGCDPLVPGSCLVPPLPAGTVLGTTPIREDIDHKRVYAYANVTFPESLTWTLGLSYDDLDREGAKVNEVNPKFGIQWDVTNTLRLRGAAFRVVKPIIVANRTIEPTQVAGFNQLFDDSNGTVSDTYGIGLDWQPADNFFVGAEAMWRNYEEVVEQITVGGGAGFTLSDPVDRDERFFRGYAYFNPVPEVSASAEVVFDRYHSDLGPGSDFFPRKVATLSIPLGLRYFHGSGFFASLGATWVDQEVGRYSVSPLEEGSDSFVTVDAGIGLRLPNRRGIVSLQVSNLFDKNFKYQDDNFREFRDEPSSGPFIPDRTILGRISLSF